jgi:hypothetical protein
VRAVNAQCDVKELVKLFAGDWDFSPDAAKDELLKAMGAKNKALAGSGSRIYGADDAAC